MPLENEPQERECEVDPRHEEFLVKFEQLLTEYGVKMIDETEIHFYNAQDYYFEYVVWNPTISLLEYEVYDRNLRG